MQKPTQNKTILTYLKSGKSLSSFQCYEILGIAKLPTRIYELRKNYDIKSDKKPFINKFGRVVYYNLYSYVGVKKKRKNITFSDLVRLITGRK